MRINCSTATRYRMAVVRAEAEFPVTLAANQLVLGSRSAPSLASGRAMVLARGWQAGACALEPHRRHVGWRPELRAACKLAPPGNALPTVETCLAS